MKLFFYICFSLDFSAVPGMTLTVALTLDAARILCRLLSMFILFFSLILSLYIFRFLLPFSFYTTLFFVSPFIRIVKKWTLHVKLKV